MFTRTSTLRSVRNNRVTLLLGIVSLLTHPAFGQSCQLQGYIKGIANQPVVVRYQQNGINYRDTIFAHQDHFVYVAKPSDDGQITLAVMRGRYASFWYEPGTIIDA